MNKSLLENGAFVSWLQNQMQEFSENAISIERLSGGSANVMYALSAGGKRIVLRMPTYPPRSNSIKGLKREARLMRALRKTSVRHAKLIKFIESDELIGAPFILLEFVDGWSLTGDHSIPKEIARQSHHKRALAFALIDALLSLRRVDIEALELGDFGKPEGFLARQVPQCLALMDSYKASENHPGRDIPGMSYVVDWLTDNRPDDHRISLIHGDLGFPNVIFGKNRPARIAAIVDWETSTLGDPLLDLGRTLLPFRGEKVGTGRSAFADFSEYPTRESLAARYSEFTGEDVSHIDYYIVLSMFRLTAMMEWNFARAENNQDPSGMARRIADYIVELMANAEKIARLN